MVVYKLREIFERIKYQVPTKIAIKENNGVDYAIAT